MFGRNPRLPIYVTIGLHVKEQQPSSKCISDLKDRISQAYHLATEAAQKAREKQKEGYDIRIRGAVIKPGERVLVKVVSFDGKLKLADRWEQDPYIVVSQPNTDIPVYNLRKENNEGRARTLHRNLLLPIGYIRDVPTPAPRNCLRDHRYLPKEPLERKIRNWNTHTLTTIQQRFHQTTSRSMGTLSSVKMNQCTVIQPSLMNH
jgi:hypothetical protein